MNTTGSNSRPPSLPARVKDTGSSAKLMTPATGGRTGRRSTPTGCGLRHRLIEIAEEPGHSDEVCGCSSPPDCGDAFLRRWPREEAKCRCRGHYQDHAIESTYRRSGGRRHRASRAGVVRTVIKVELTPDSMAACPKSLVFGCFVSTGLHRSLASGSTGAGPGGFPAPALGSYRVIVAAHGAHERESVARFKGDPNELLRLRHT